MRERFVEPDELFSAQSAVGRPVSPDQPTGHYRPGEQAGMGVLSRLWGIKEEPIVPTREGDTWIDGGGTIHIRTRDGHFEIDTTHREHGGKLSRGRHQVTHHTSSPDGRTGLVEDYGYVDYDTGCESEPSAEKG